MDAFNIRGCNPFLLENNLKTVFSRKILNLAVSWRNMTHVWQWMKVSLETTSWTCSISEVSIDTIGYMILTMAYRNCFKEFNAYKNIYDDFVLNT